MSFTKRHHFIPQFYLRQFTRDDGRFYIYLPKEDKFKDNGRLFYPKQQFFEKYGNTTFYSTQESDFIERSFSKIDSEIAEIVKKSNDTTLLEEKDWLLIQHFVNIMYWRLPINTDKVKEYIKNAESLSAFKMTLMDKVTSKRRSQEEELELLHKIKTDLDFHKFLKLMLPIITFPERLERDINDFATIITIPFGATHYKMVSDNPIIYKRLQSESLQNDEFIFMLSPTKILFRHRIKKILIHSLIKPYIDMLSMLQAHEYVSSTDLKYPRTLQEQYYKHFNSEEKLREAIFNLIFSPDDKRIQHMI